jgi:hypothetical protein
VVGGRRRRFLPRVALAGMPAGAVAPLVVTLVVIFLV